MAASVKSSSLQFTFMLVQHFIALSLFQFQIITSSKFTEHFLWSNKVDSLISGRNDTVLLISQWGRLVGKIISMEEWKMSSLI